MTQSGGKSYGVGDLTEQMRSASLSHGKSDTTEGTAELMKRLQIDIGDTTMAPRIGEVAQGGRTLQTNVFDLYPKKGTRVYRYTVTVIGTLKNLGADGEPIKIDLTKRAKGDYITVDRRNRCRDVFQAAVIECEQLRGKRVYYDLQSILYSLDVLCLNGVPLSSMSWNVDSSSLPQECAHFKSCEISIDVPGEGHSEMDISDIQVVSNDALEKEGRDVLQFYDVLTSQYVMFTPQVFTTFSAQSSYLNEGHYKAYGFTDDDLAVFHNRARLLPGAMKGTRYVEGERGTLPVAALVVEAKKTPFHVPGSALDKARSLVNDLGRLFDEDMRSLRGGLNGLYVETTHSRSKQLFFIKDVTMGSAEGTSFVNEQGVGTTVAEYFERTYFRLNHPQYPLVVARGKGKGGGDRYFPLEVLNILPYQRVKSIQQTPQLVQAAIKKCAVAPTRLIDHVNKTVESLNLKKGRFLVDAGVEIRGPRMVNSGVIYPPAVLYGAGRSIPVRPDSTWNPGNCKFHNAVRITNWAAVTFVDHRAPDWDAFVRMFIQQCIDRGMEICQPAIRSSYRNIGQMQQAFMELAQREIEFVLFLHADVDKIVHENLKFMERRSSIITQAIRRMTMQNVVNKDQRLTMGNIVAKTNMKMGGMDYILAEPAPGSYQLLGKGDLFIGIAVNHPFGGVGGAEPTMDKPQQSTQQPTPQFPGKREGSGIPSVIGYSANVGNKNDFEFIGDFCFQSPDREVRPSVVPEIVGRCVEKFRATCNGDPNRIIIYRSGLNEGYYSKILMFDIPLVKHKMREMNCHSPLSMIMVNKVQNVRFFEQNPNPQVRASEQNVQPGTVIDSGVVHPLHQEFFLVSHRALQGTSRIPKYTVLIDESKIPVQDLETMTYQLCYGHQIVNFPTSLPSPLYIAIRYAERGRKLYSSKMREPGAHGTFDKLNEELTYKGLQWLSEWRINA